MRGVERSIGHRPIGCARCYFWLFLSGIFAADGLVASIAFHNTFGAKLACRYLVGIAIAGAVLIWHPKISWHRVTTNDLGYS